MITVLIKRRSTGGVKAYLDYHAQMSADVAWKYGGRMVFVAETVDDPELVIGVGMFPSEESLKAYGSDPDVLKLRASTKMDIKSSETTILNSYTSMTGGFAPLVDENTVFVYGETTLSVPFSTFLAKTMSVLESGGFSDTFAGTGMVAVSASDQSKAFILMVFKSKAAYDAYADAGDDAIAAREARGSTYSYIASCTMHVFRSA